ncbi:DUF1801 domain-containing protein [Leptospira fluminis]|uniref:DUF1801 domain-containing protein n=1 Tax=Leptospira fluminis TaxID=2484979 RepID=A0A4R9GRG4_9LEPT|nr:DUF1801 domain-containing protein [Leptospira fluminis]TGK20738.1 DUF1801 domain-containing protein [Leptospira fluminis]
MLLYALVPTLPRFDLDHQIESPIDSYVQRASEIRKERMQELLEFVRSEFPDLRETLKNNMPTLERNGKSLSFANQKSYLTVQFRQESFVRAFKIKAPNITCGKTRINLRDKDKIPMVYLKSLIKKALSDRTGKA